MSYLAPLKKFTHTLAATTLILAGLSAALPAGAAPVPSTTKSDVTGPATGVADAINYTVTATVRDGSGNPLGTVWVTLSSSRGSTDTVSPAGGAASDDSGQVHFTVSTITAGTSVYTASMGEFGNITDTHTIVYSSVVSPATSSVSASPSSVPADGAATVKLTITARKSTNQPVPNRTFTVSSSRGGQDTIAPASGTTDALGQAVVNIKSCEPGSPTLTTRVDGVTLTSPSISFTTDTAPSAGSSEMMQSAASAPANNSTTVTITVNALNACNRVIAGATVTLSSNRDGQDTIAPASATTNAAGSTTFTVRSGVTGTSTYTARISGVTVSDTAAVNYTTASPTPDTTPPTVGSVSPITATVNVAQTYAASVSDNVGISECSFYVDGVSQATAVGSGLAQLTFTFGASGSHTMYVRCADGAGNIGVGPTATITVSVPPAGSRVSPTRSTVGASPVAVTANGSSQSLVTVQVLNDAGVPQGGIGVTLSSSLAGVSFVAGPSTVTNPSGIAEFPVSSATAGTARFTAVADGISIVDDATVTFTAPDAPPPPPPANGGRRIKLACPRGATVNNPCKAVYYVSSDGKRHAFPNDKVYFTWYADFSGVEVVTADEMSSHALGQNVTYRPGVRLVKFQTLAKTYAVSRGGVLRWITSEDVARSLYGTDWNRKVDDVSDAFYTNYSFGADIVATAEFNPLGETSLATSIDLNF